VVAFIFYTQAFDEKETLHLQKPKYFKATGFLWLVYSLIMVDMYVRMYAFIEAVDFSSTSMVDFHSVFFFCIWMAPLYLWLIVRRPKVELILDRRATVTAVAALLIGAPLLGMAIEQNFWNYRWDCSILIFIFGLFYIAARRIGEYLDRSERQACLYPAVAAKTCLYYAAVELVLACFFAEQPLLSLKPSLLSFPR